MRKAKLKRRTTIKLLSYLTASFLVVSGIAVAGWVQAFNYRTYIEHDYQKSFFDLASQIGAIDTALQKGMYSTSPSMLSQLSSEVARESASASNSLSQLPFSFVELENTAKFISQAGDYANTMAKLSASGNALGETDAKNMVQLSKTAKMLAEQLYSLQSIINEENLKIGDVIKAEKEFSSEQGGAKLFGDSFKNIESEFSNLPSLIYDGPFSEHLNKREAEFLKGEKEVSVDQAEKKALTFLNMKEGQIKLSHEGTGRIPFYSFTGQLNGGEVSIDVSKVGGYVINMLNSRYSTNAEFKPQQAVIKAASFLLANGYKNMKESYWEVFDNTLIVNFAYSQDNVVCYSDLIKVGVALDTCEIVSVEMLGYLMNHKSKRDNISKTISIEDAKSKLAKTLTVIEQGECIVPSAGEHEVFCYEFTCETAEKQRVMVFVNAQTGAEEKILILIQNENGTLSI